MKILYLFRHGDAETNKNSDYNRELTVPGINMTELMAEYIKAEIAPLDKIICSGAPRAKKTALIIAKNLSYPIDSIDIDDIIYDAKGDAELFQLIHKTPENITSLMIVGHNPVLSDLASSLAKNIKKIDMSKSSIVKLNLDSLKWDDVIPGSGTVVFYKRPVNNNIEMII